MMRLYEITMFIGVAVEYQTISNLSYLVQLHSFVKSGNIVWFEITRKQGIQFLQCSISISMILTSITLSWRCNFRNHRIDNDRSTRLSVHRQHILELRHHTGLGNHINNRTRTCTTSQTGKYINIGTLSMSNLVYPVVSTQQSILVILNT